MSAPGSGVVAANGIQIAYETFGDRCARPLLMVTGLGPPMLTWHPAWVTTCPGPCGLPWPTPYVPWLTEPSTRGADVRPCDDAG